MKYLVIFPTYNEKDNIQQIVPEVLKVDSQIQVLVVDDNSPDGTGAVVQNMCAVEPRIHLLSRPGKQGLGRAYVAAFDWAIQRGFDVIVEMDADFSHRPKDLGSLVLASKSCDFVVGSRYIQGGGVTNWGLFRRLLSLGGSLYARLILGYSIRDGTGGFNLWHRRVLEKIDISTILSDGYSFQIELKYRALKCGFHGVEVPILFEERRAGQSKMSGRIIFEALYRVWKIRFR